MFSVLGNGAHVQGSADSLLTDLVAWWKLDETSGTRYDAHGSYDLTDNNTVGYTTGKQSNAAAFVAANDECLTVSHNADFQILSGRDFSICGWASISSSSDNYSPVVGKGIVNTNGGWNMRKSTSAEMQFIARNSSNTGYVTAPVSITFGTPFFFLLEYTDSTGGVALEINRSASNSTILSGGQYSGESGVFEIGGDITVSNKYIDGWVDEVAVWHRLLTSDEKDRLYNSGVGMTYPG